jgi:small-conductance mechanosensitive channel
MLKYSEVTVGQRPMRSYTWKNQSLVGVSNRLLRHVDADASSATHQPVYVNFADFKFPVVNAIIVGIALALGMVFIAAMPDRDMRTAESDAIEFALLLLLMLMLTPLSFGYFYSWLMLPLAVITQRVLDGSCSGILLWSLPALALLTLGIAIPRGAQLYGNTFFSTLLLFIGLSIELLHFKQQKAHTRPAGELSS